MAESDTDEKKSSHDELVDNTEQPFLTHIIELRSRILRGMLVVVLIFSHWLRWQVADFLMVLRPDRQVDFLPQGTMKRQIERKYEKKERDGFHTQGSPDTL